MFPLADAAIDPPRPAAHVVDPLPDPLPDPLLVTFLGRSTVQLVLDGVRVLTDPNLPGPRRLPWSRRVTAVEPPGADVVLISHGHSRHMDLATLRRLTGAPRIIVPAGNGASLRRNGLTRVEEVQVGDAIRVGDLVIHAIGAEHGALHGALAPRHQPVGFVIDGTSRVYFAGDSIPFVAMERLTGIDLALLPVAPVLRYVGQLSPADAAETAARVAPRVVVPIHWGSLGMDEPAPLWSPPREQFTAERLEAALLSAFESRGVNAELRLVLPGYSTTVEPLPQAARRAGIAGAAVARDDGRGAAARRNGAPI